MKKKKTPIDEVWQWSTEVNVEFPMANAGTI